MAKAFSPNTEEAVGNGDGTFTVIVMTVFSGPEVPTGTDISPVYVRLDGGDSPVSIRNTKISDSILAAKDINKKKSNKKNKHKIKAIKRRKIHDKSICKSRRYKWTF